MLRAEIGKRVVVHRHAAAKPTIRRMALTQAVQFPCTAYPAQGGVQPQRHQDAWIGGRLSRTTLHGLNPLVQRRKVETAHIIPHNPRLMLLGKQFIERTLLQFDLIAHCKPQPSGPNPRRRLVGGLHFQRQPSVEQLLLVHRPSSDLPGLPGVRRIKPVSNEKVFLFYRKIHKL